MSKKKGIPEKYQIWIDVRKRYRLSDVHIQMARELGMNPKKFGKIANEKQEPWKAPLPAFIEHIYLKRFGRDRPPDVKSIEEVFRTKEKKKEEQRKKKQLQKEAGPSDQKTNSFTPLESPRIYTGDVRNRKHPCLRQTGASCSCLPAGREGGVKALPFLTGFALEKA